jgi:hypothetical protein
MGRAALWRSSDDRASPSEWENYSADYFIDFVPRIVARGCFINEAS